MSCDRWARTWLGGERGTLWFLLGIQFAFVGDSSPIGHVLSTCLILGTGMSCEQKIKDKSVLEKSIGETVVWLFP